MGKIIKMPKFTAGRVVLSTGVKRFIPEGEVAASLQRHIYGDYGILSLDDWQVNEDVLQGLDVEGRTTIVSSYEYIDENNEIIPYLVITCLAGKITEVILGDEMI